MSEILSIEEIEKRYAPDWVLINNPQSDENLKLLAGEVISVSKDRNELYGQATELKLGHVAVHYLGEIKWPEHLFINIGIEHIVRPALDLPCEALPGRLDKATKATP